MTTEEFLKELCKYEAILNSVTTRFTKHGNYLTIGPADRKVFKQTVHEVIDLITDGLKSPAQYAGQIETKAAFANNNFLGSPSKSGIEDVVTVLQSLITRVQRNPGLVAEVPSSSDNNTLTWQILHPKVVSLAKPRFENGLYADAVESVMKELNGIVRDLHHSLSGQELDGVNLMRNAFSLTGTIKLNEIETLSGRDTQVGYRDIFAGAMAGIRNPKAHDNVLISRERAIHHLFVASLLFFKLDERPQ